MASGDADASESASIQVAVRVRPLVSRESKDPVGARLPLACTDQSVQVCSQSVRPDGTTGHAEGKLFGYDRVFGPEATQAAVFEALGAKLLANALDAYNGCIFAYGQTGSGKSHSVVGDVHSEAERGLLPRACERLFEALGGRQEEDPSLQANVLASYLEIYNEKLFDLLAGDRDTRGELQVRLHPSLGAVVPNLSECPVQSSSDALALLDFGAKRRATAATQMNATSSRSHAVFTLQLRMVAPRRGGSVERYAKVHFVDLAGSERQKKTGAEGDRLKEGIGINKSLTTLGRVISDLSKPGGRSIPPFRDSKLTLLLKDALMGNSRTALLACVSPSRDNLDESVSTLEFASRCKLVQTQATRNEQSKQDVIAKLTCEKEQLEARLRQERADSESICSRLREELRLAAENHAAAEGALAERRAIEAKLRELELQHSDLQRSKEMQLLELQERERQAEQSCRQLREREQLQEQELTRQRAELEALARAKKEAEQLAEAEREERERELQTRREAPVAEAAARERQLRSHEEQLGRVSCERQAACAAESSPEPARSSRPSWRQLQELSRSTSTPSRLATSEERSGCQLATANADAPGEYVVVRRTWVTLTSSMHSERIVQLDEGKELTLLEVVNLPEERRVRGRLAEPAGWISIQDTSDGLRWAAPAGRGEEASALQRRLSELAAQEAQTREEARREQELRERLQREREVQEAREQELLSQLEVLKGVKESFEMEQTQIDEKRDIQRRQRETELHALGMHAVGMGMEEMAQAPKLVNLHPDPALKGCLVYYLPAGETWIGSGSGCRVTLRGLDIGAEVCAISNEGNEVLSVRSLGGGLVRVNGHVVGSADSQKLRHGDRLAVGRAYIFQVHIPLAQGDR